MKLLLLLAVIALAGCDAAPAVPESAKVQSTAVRSSGGPDALRVRVDTVRNRVWMLAADHVDVYDRRTDTLIRRIALPRWSVADFICAPDIAFDRSGTAFISHNLEPRLWQIDADSFELKDHRIRLLGREQLDIGFGRLVFAPDGTLFGVASAGGSLWRIDIGSATAHQVELAAPALDACAPQ